MARSPLLLLSIDLEHAKNLFSIECDGEGILMQLFSERVKSGRCHCDPFPGLAGYGHGQGCIYHLNPGRCFCGTCTWQAGFQHAGCPNGAERSKLPKPPCRHVWAPSDDGAKVYTPEALEEAWKCLCCDKKAAKPGEGEGRIEPIIEIEIKDEEPEEGEITPPPAAASPPPTPAVTKGKRRAPPKKRYRR